MTSSSTNKETDVSTPVPMSVMLAALAAAIAMHIVGMEKGIHIARSLPANIAGCADALQVTDIVLLQNLLNHSSC